MNAKISAKIAIQVRQSSESPFLVMLELFNEGDAAVYVLKWDTPLEGLFSDCFDVRRDGEPIPYDGPLVKRGVPTADNYVRIRSGGRAVSEVDLSACYQVSVPGKYDIAFRGNLPDVVSTAELRAKAKADPMARVPVQLKVLSRKFAVRSGMHGRATAGEAVRRQEETTLSQAPKARKPRAKKKPVAPSRRYLMAELRANRNRQEKRMEMASNWYRQPLPG